VLVDPVGRQDEDVAPPDLERAVVDLELRVEADGAAEIALVARNPDAVILRELLERLAIQPVDPRVADVEDVGRRRLDAPALERADVALLLVVPILALPRLGVQPRVGRVDHALDRSLHRPRVGRAVVIVDEAVDRELGGDLRDVAGADAVGERDGDALGAEQRVLRRAVTIEVLVDRLASLVGILPDQDAQLRFRQLF